MTASTRARRLVAAVLGTVLVAGTLVLLGPGPALADSPDHHRPAVGDCYDLSAAQGAATSAPRRLRVRCDEEHTAEVLTTVRVPRSLRWRDDEATYAAVAPSCWSRFGETLGGSSNARVRSAYSIVYFIPTPSERRHGARWVSCHLILHGGSVLMALPTDGDPAVGSLPLDDSIAGCLTGADTYTVCARPHRHRATGAFRVRGGYPASQRALERLADRRCPALTTGRHWVWTTHGPTAYRSGERSMACYSRTED